MRSSGGVHSGREEAGLFGSAAPSSVLEPMIQTGRTVIGLNASDAAAVALRAESNHSASGATICSGTDCYSL